MSADDLEPLGDITIWVDTTLMDEGNGPPVSTRLAERQSDRKLVSMGSFVDGVGANAAMAAAAGVLSTMTLHAPERELLAMRNAELEQCAVDNFWGVVANQRQQAGAIAAMEREDLESHAVRAQIEKEAKFALWEEEDLRTRETRSAMRERLEYAAIRAYLEVRICDLFCHTPDESNPRTPQVPHALLCLKQSIWGADWSGYHTIVWSKHDLSSGYL